MPRRPSPMLPLFLTVFLDMLGVGIAIPVLGVIFFDTSLHLLPETATLGTRTLWYGLLIASYPAAQFFGAPILGALSDQHGRKPVLIASLAGTGIGYLLFALGILNHSLPLLFASRLLDGFTGGNIATAMSAIADVSTPQNRPRNFGLVGMAFGLGFILGPFIGGQLADPNLVSWFNGSTPFFFAALLTFANMALCALVFQETLVSRRATPVSVLTGVRNITRALGLVELRAVLLTVFFLTLGFNFFTQFFNIYLVNRFQYSEPDIGRMFAYVGLWIAGTQGLLTRPVSARFSAAPIIRATSLGLALTFPLLIVPSQSLWLYLVLPFVAMFQGLLQPNTTTIISGMADAESQGEIMGIHQSIQSLAMIIPPIVSGLIAGYDVRLPIVMASVLTLVAWMIFVTGHRATSRLFHEAP